MNGRIALGAGLLIATCCIVFLLKPPPTPDAAPKVHRGEVQQEVPSRLMQKADGDDFVPTDPESLEVGSEREMKGSDRLRRQNGNQDSRGRSLSTGFGRSAERESLPLGELRLPIERDDIIAGGARGGLPTLGSGSAPAASAVPSPGEYSEERARVEDKVPQVKDYLGKVNDLLERAVQDAATETPTAMP